MIVEPLAAPALSFDDPRADVSVSQRPIDDPVFEQVIKKVPEPPGEVHTALAESATADTIENLPNRD